MDSSIVRTWPETAAAEPIGGAFSVTVYPIASGRRRLHAASCRGRRMLGIPVISWNFPDELNMYPALLFPLDRVESLQLKFT